MSSGSEKRQRGKTVTIRFTDSEHAALLDNASNSGLALADYVRSVVLSAKPLRAVRRHSVDRVALARVHSELGKIGSNINQIAHVLNASGRNRPALLDRSLTEMLVMRDLLLQAMGIREP